MKQYPAKSKEELYSNEIIIIIDEVSANNFLILEVENKKYGIAWNGYSKPQIEQITDFDLLVIGVGESIVAVSISTGIIKLALGLGYPFNFFELIDNGFFIVSELTIIGINGYDCSISRYIIATDIILNVKVDGYKFVVECLDIEFTA